MRSGLWSRRLSRWRTRKSLPTDQAALRAASATARDVSPGLRPGGAPWRRGRCASWRRGAPAGPPPPPPPPPPRHPDRRRGRRREGARHFAAQVTRIRLEWMPKVVTAAAKSAEVAGGGDAEGKGG